MKRELLFVVAILGLISCNPSTKKENKKNPVLTFDSWADTPPMGWNSYDCLGLDANEDQVTAVADYMALHLKQYGWEYVVIDAGWYHPTATNWMLKNPSQNIDKYGRLIPDTVKYPSAGNGVGFKALADYIHSKGLKFGIHVMRGIPWNAVTNNTPIKGTNYYAQDVANVTDTCSWSKTMKGVYMEKSGAQEYYNSVFEMYAEWGVDFVKVDDISNPYHRAEIEGIHQAIMNSKAPIVLSLSPGPAPVTEWAHLEKNAHMWRISADFWDNWKWLKRHFEICSQWDSIHTPGHWPDADMLPIGKLRKNGGDAWIASQLGGTIAEVTDEYSRFTDTEKYTLMTLWSIFKSPLMIGGYLPENDSATFKIITNEEVIALDQQSENNHEVRNQDGIVIWTADQPGTTSKYVAVFNTNDGKAESISVLWSEIGVTGESKVRDLWAKKDLGKFNDKISLSIEPHGCQLVKIGK